MDLGGPAIASARKMAAGEPPARLRFEAGRITAKSVDRLLPPPAAEAPEALLLDPPRQGTEPGVIRALAARNPARILHIFCDMDTLPREVNLWRKSGYMVSKVVPLDMFPGTDDLEVMVLFIPDRYGILNRIDKERFKRTVEGGTER
jgi:tRNA/tmRNA/rRNA uracil-C5-methylase (TrmA/RlmC/RlmD family)